jgi:diguanylate cyclase (GGDEF)-like protein/PAS domain S-box-containing protein
MNALPADLHATEFPELDPARDNVELALALRELVVARHALARLENRHRRLFDGFEDGVVVIDGSGRIEAINPGAAALFGGTESAVRNWLWPAPASDASEEVVHPAVEALLDGRPRVGVEMPARAADGLRRWLAVSARPVLDPASGCVQSVVCSFTDVTERRAVREDLERQATVDPLTGLFNRRYLESRLAAEASRAQRSRMPLALALADLDRFKQVNDRHGHAGGDRALRAFAAVLRETLRTEDVVARFGGDEFCVLFPATTAQAALVPLQRLLGQLASREIESPCGAFHVAGSFGLAALRPGMGPAALLAKADAALYAAKAAGRGRVQLSD